MDPVPNLTVCGVFPKREAMVCRATLNISRYYSRQLFTPSRKCTQQVLTSFTGVPRAHRERTVYSRLLVTRDCHLQGIEKRYCRGRIGGSSRKMPRSDASLDTETMSDFSYDPDEEYRLAQKEWEESIEELQQLALVLLLPWAGKFIGRKTSYWRK